MTPETLNSLLKLQTTTRIRALKYSFGVIASKSTAAKASSLASHINNVRPGIYKVGNCYVDLWQMSCTCSQSRKSRQSHTCPHFIALYLALIWIPGDPNPTAYLQKLHVFQPRIIAIYARINEWKGYHLAHRITARIEHSGQPGTCLAILPDGSQSYINLSACNRITPFYE